MTKTKEIFLEVGFEEFLINYEENDGWYTGTAYPIRRWTKVASGEEGWSYVSDQSSDDVDNLEDGVRIMFEFRFVWRGVWEGRIYFKDDEYWSEELKTMHQLWDQIELILKDEIRKKEPDREFED